MPSYKLPKEEHSYENDMNMVGSPDCYKRMIRIPINDEIMDTLAVGDRIDVTLMG